MQRKRTFRDGALALLLLYYPTLFLGFPLIVLAGGFSYDDARDYPLARPPTTIGLLVFPLVFIAVAGLLESL